MKPNRNLPLTLLIESREAFASLYQSLSVQGLSTAVTTEMGIPATNTTLHVIVLTKGSVVTTITYMENTLTNAFLWGQCVGYENRERRGCL